MDDDLEAELNQIVKNIDDAVVMSLFFPTFRKAVIIDTRSNDEEGPMVRIMPMAASPQERMRSIRRLRPKFPRLETLTLIPWPRYVDSLVRMGVWERVVKRIRDAGREDAVALCDSLLEQLRHMEREELASVVLGENYHTIWAADR